MEAFEAPYTNGPVGPDIGEPDTCESDFNGEIVRRSLTAGWQFRQAGKEDWLSAKVPSSNISDLLAHGLIADPLVGDNESRMGWVEEADWEYSLEFHVSAAELACERALLTFEGLDTHCEVQLNGQPILHSSNMFQAHGVAVDGLLAAGSNRLDLRFRSPLSYGREALAANGHGYPAENDKTEGHISVFSRKAPYHFGWDWGPKLIPCGIWKPIHLEFHRSARLLEFRHEIVELDDARAEIRFDLEGEAYAADHSNCVIELLVDGVLASRTQTDLSAGSLRASIKVTIDEPNLWWPSGSGEPHLYAVTVRLLMDGQEIDSRTMSIGLRTIVLVREADNDGTSFFVRVNGRPVFMKGANVIPPDSLIEHFDETRMRRLLEDAVAANMNMLRVWGGGVYLPDHFYELADEYGVLIWQDFMFACTLYPSDEAFLTSVKAEVEHQVRRLRHHACIALWCGNNEISMGISDWGWKENFAYSDAQWDDMVAGNARLFDDLIPGVLAESDPSRYYLPSSPAAFWESAPEQEAHGDSHFWGVWHGGLPFATYAERVPRFMSEYGFQSFPLIDTIARFAEEEDRFLGSAVMLAHQKHQRGTQIISEHLREEYGEPRDLAQFCYLSQLQQADGLRIAFEAHRRAMPHCMGSLYWQHNDCWPCASWSSMDYYGTWKALHYQARRSFAPVMLSIEESGDGTICVHVVSDLSEQINATLRVTLRKLDGTVLSNWTDALEIQASSSARTMNIARSEFPQGFDPSDTILVAELVDYPDCARVLHYFIAQRQMALSDPVLRVELHAADVGTRLNVSCKAFARGVCLSVPGRHDTAPGLAENFSDNFFDLFPGEVRSIFISRGDVTDNQLRIYSLFDAVERL